MKRGQEGFLLVEVLIAMLLLVLMAGSVFAAIKAAQEGAAAAREREQMLWLAKSRLARVNALSQGWSEAPASWSEDEHGRYRLQIAVGLHPNPGARTVRITVTCPSCPRRSDTAIPTVVLKGVLWQ